MIPEHIFVRHIVKSKYRFSVNMYCIDTALTHHAKIFDTLDSKVHHINTRTTSTFFFIMAEKRDNVKFIYERKDQLENLAGELVDNEVKCGRKCARRDQCQSFYFLAGRCGLVVPSLKISKAAPPDGQPCKLYVRAP